MSPPEETPKMRINAQTGGMLVKLVFSQMQPGATATANDVAKAIGASLSAVQPLVRDLVEEGHLYEQRRGGEPSLYRLATTEEATTAQAFRDYRAKLVALGQELGATVAVWRETKDDGTQLPFVRLSAEDFEKLATVCTEAKRK